MIGRIKRKSKIIVSGIINKAIAYSFHQDQKYNDLLYIFNCYVNHGFVKSINFEFDEYADGVIGFVESMKTIGPFSYRYAPSVPRPTIYGSVYACLLIFLLGRDIYLSNEQKSKWVEYLDSFQNEEGVFVDPALEGVNYYNCEWWGANHLALHLIICYSYLGRKPRNQFNYIKKYYNPDILKDYLNKLEFKDIIHADSDNALMTLGSLLQYQRDVFNDYQAGEILEFFFNELENRINPKYGSWGYGSDDDMFFLSRAQQFAYHLYPLWIYDKRPIKHIEKIIDLSLRMQNILGGFGANLNSSACEDIDSIDLLIKLGNITDYRKGDIKMAMLKAFPWVLANQNKDGGFVFKRNEPFIYGHYLTSSLKNESNLFATWFRTLSIAYLCNILGIKSNFNIGICPGLHFL